MSSLTNSRIFKFAVGAGGIYGAYIVYGLIQERLFHHDYTGNPNEKFNFSFSVLLFQNLFSYILASCINRYYYNQDKSKMDLQTELIIGGCNWGTMICANTALQFVSYPVQALLKSSKIISILMVSLCFATGKKFSKNQYISGVIITVGIIIFNLFAGKDKGDKSTSIIGLVLLGISLFCDGMIGVKQTEAKEKFKPSAFDQMESANKWGLLFTLGFSLATFQMGQFVFFCYHYPAVIVDLSILAFLGTVGQVFIFYVIFNFSPFVLSIVTTTRKFFTVLASIFFYNHAINTTQWVSIALVFAGVAMEFYNENNKKHHGAEKKEKQAVAKDDSVELSHVTQVSIHRHEDETDKLK